jgi:hypothetical protein
MQLDPHTDKKWGGPDPGTPTGSPPVAAAARRRAANADLVILQLNQISFYWGK